MKTAVLFIGTCLVSFSLQAAPPVTFTHDVAPILYKHCVACHHPNDIAPMSLLTYKDARPWAASIKQAVVSGKMPPWKADPHFGKWSNDPRLSDAEIAAIKAWTEGEKLEGEPKEMPAVPSFPDGWKIGKPDAVIAIPEHKLEGTGPDEYTYVTVPTNFTEDRWIVAAELRPGNRRVVHHAHVFVVEKQEEPKSADRKKDDPQAEYVRWLQVHQGSLEWVRPEAPVIDNGCSVDDNGRFPGQKSSDLGSLISSYLPGRAPDVYPSGTARKIPAGSTLNFQIHYSHTTGKPEVDATSVGLIFAKEPPKEISRRIDLSNNMFIVPAGDPDHPVSECHTFDKDVLITSLTPHMHLRGKSMRIVADLPGGEKQTLLNVPNYNFNWQITYRAQDPIFLPKGTRIEILAAFDNSANNPLNPDPTKTIRWGSASESEMMDGWIEYLDADSSKQPTKSTVASLKN